MRRVVNGRQRVVTGIKPATGALHDAVGRVGEVVLRPGPRHAELALVAPALGVAVLVVRRAVVVVAAAAAALDVGIALALRQALPGFGEGLGP